MQQRPDFGLDDLSEFEPRAQLRRVDPQIVRQIESIGAEQGFVPREETKPIRVKRADPGPTTGLFIRLSVSEFNRFVRLSQDARRGRADFLVELMDAYERRK